jgi:predicted GTPase
MHNRQDFGCHINVIDTPGFGDSQNRDEEFFQLIQNAILNTAINQGGIHCFLMVFKISTS